MFGIGLSFIEIALRARYLFLTDEIIPTHANFVFYLEPTSCVVSVHFPSYRAPYCGILKSSSIR
jgi:hypothetical protein